MRLAGEGWEAFFQTFEREAFRLETLPVYRVEGEREEFEAFLATGRQDVPADDSWLEDIRHYRATDRWIGRVHVITRPLTDYLRFEFDFYQHSARAGEEVRILDLTEQPNPGLPVQDFWMFDESKIVRMDYAEDGTQLGRELLEDIDPAPYVEWKRIALERSEPFLEYYARMHE
ncbi:hypothetical protein EV193_103413 [Herbihabitans rhizosphaerae]|uniref:DUF6879 domain-containing protein n=1 Tax=Herbihabitans rhizosphaerae TaxID=1872711 RepID=A0A4Q7KWM2_9PSEU|nr:DUF6879 family protein [Herbihabitans rhizosphaerae]RZS41095.1 hypothetical protein EV193_103413 [Herbihabitans rhizosphaerae]